MSEESSDAIYGHLVTSQSHPDDILRVFFDRKVQVRTNEICLFVMRGYIKIIPNYTKISAHSVRFSYKINNQSKFVEHG